MHEREGGRKEERGSEQEREVALKEKRESKVALKEKATSGFSYDL